MKILCPVHNDSTPSMHVYENGDELIGFCFVCSARVVLDEKLLPSGTVTKSSTTKENVQTTLEYIKSLPKKEIRGLLLPFDSRGYYIIWPSNDFYKRRNWDGKERYKGPKGLRPPLLVLPGNRTQLVVVEGELNAISLWTSMSTYGMICSPGAAPELTKVYDFAKSFKTITIFVDNDAPGILYGNRLKEKLLKRGRRVTLVPMDKDFNQLLVEGGSTSVLDFYYQSL